VGAGTKFLTSTHDIGGPEKRAGTWRTAPITVGRGCWLGANVTVLPGVRIGDGCVIAAGTVVTKDCEPDTLYAGVPAQAKRRL
jgi:maltose O-acetyltransferase